MDTKNVQALIETLAAANAASRDALVELGAVESLPTVWAVMMRAKREGAAAMLVTAYETPEAAAENARKTGEQMPDYDWFVVEYAPIPF